MSLERRSIKWGLDLFSTTRKAEWVCVLHKSTRLLPGMCIRICHSKQLRLISSSAVIQHLIEVVVVPLLSCRDEGQASMVKHDVNLPQMEGFGVVCTRFRQGSHGRLKWINAHQDAWTFVTTRLDWSPIRAFHFCLFIIIKQPLQCYGVTGWLSNSSSRVSPSTDSTHNPDHSQKTRCASDSVGRIFDHCVLSFIIVMEFVRMKKQTIPKLLSGFA